MEFLVSSDATVNASTSRIKVLSSNQNISDSPKENESNTCFLCSKCSESSIPLSSLKQRFVRELKRAFPLKQFSSNDRICIFHLNTVLQNRIETIVDEDNSGLARLHDEAMRNLGEFEQQEPNWQKRFEVGWTRGERAADLVAQFGGSWRFIGILLSFLLSWAILNIILENAGSKPWDPYPFILLNLFLSSLAAFQAPIIMMSQNRQSQIDRTQSEYISRIILRAENQVRHANAKLDHLLNNQWKRLLEIQQTQVDMLQFLQASQPLPSPTSIKLAELSINNSPEIPKSVDVLSDDISGFLRRNSMGGKSMNTLPQKINGLSFAWTMETFPDHHARMLLSLHYEVKSSPYYENQELIFAHWHSDGDNFMGLVENVLVQKKLNIPDVKRIVYDVVFQDPTASLDDILSGEGTVTLRNDFDMKCMNLQGRILKTDIYRSDTHSLTYTNGDLPPRYKSAFHMKRNDKITEFWQERVYKLNITYSPPHQLAILELNEGQRVDAINIDFFPESNVDHAKVFMSKQNVEECLIHIVDQRPLNSTWTCIAYALWPENSVPGSNSINTQSAISVGMGGLGDGEEHIIKGRDNAVLMEAGVVTVQVMEKLVGPGVFVFFCDETRVSFHAHIVE